MEKVLIKPKLTIIGAGISGLTAGIYALDNGFDVTIYEKHNIVGGECTGWTRKGLFIDGCAHWIVGTNPNSDFYRMWKHIGAIDQHTVIHETEYFLKFDIDGEVVTFYSDLNKLEDEFLRVAPEDKRAIRSFINGIYAYQHVSIPVNKPIDWMNPFEAMVYGLKFVPMLTEYIIYKHISIARYAKRFKSPILREVFKRVMRNDYNVHSLFYVMQSLSMKDAGMIEGGSVEIAKRIENRYLELGGKLVLNAPVKRILTEKSVARGIELESGKRIISDYVISAVDAHHAIYDLLDSQYKDKFLEEKFEDRKNNPLNTSMLFAFKVKKDLTKYPKMIDFAIPKFYIADTLVEDLPTRNYAFDTTLNTNSDASLVTVLIPTLDGVYDYFKAMSKEEYKKAKNELGLKIMKYVQEYFEIPEDKIELIDVTTPLTYERYCNAYRGSYMAFVTTGKSKGLMKKGLLKGLKNFALAGQWIMPPGGLPIALFSGKYAAMRVCKMNNQKFKNLDKPNIKFKAKAAV
ncbi:MAG: NAD(P)/FAD-dependent oxidoreductase [Bacilli bacterium]|nr:NAD(P)/FAD-dependent oxidoreductase [Bacilli bacterium]